MAAVSDLIPITSPLHQPGLPLTPGKNIGRHIRGIMQQLSQRQKEHFLPWAVLSRGMVTWLGRKLAAGGV